MRRSVHDGAAKRRRRFGNAGRSVGALALAAVLAVGLLPFPAVADEVPAEQTDATTPAAAAAAQIDYSIAHVEGQALVVYRVGGQADFADSSGDESSAPDARNSLRGFSFDGQSDGSAGDASESSDEAPLEDAGFSVQQTWDFSPVDASSAAPMPLAANGWDGEDEGAAGAGAGDASASDADALQDASPIPEGDDVRVALVESDSLSTEDLIAQLAQLDFVEAVQPNYTHELASFNDTYYDDWQYALHDSADACGIDLEAALEVRPSGGGDGGNIVAVIDTGVDVSHPDLQDNLWSKSASLSMLPGEEGSHGYDFVDGDSDPSPGSTSVASHGTHCAGVIAAQSNNAQGIAGIAQNTQIMALKCGQDQSDGQVYDSVLVSAYSYVVGALLAGENVVAISNSWSFAGYSPVLDYLVNQAGRAGALSFFAAGNYSSDTDNLLSASTVGLESPYAVVVASSNQNNTLSSFSNYNVTDVDVAAPGSRILSTVSTKASSAYFNAELSHQAGKELMYWDDFSEYGSWPVAEGAGDPGYSVGAYFYYDAGYLEPVEAEVVEKVVRVEPATGGLKVTVDFDQLWELRPDQKEEGFLSSRFTVQIYRTVSNPFCGLGENTLSAADFAISSSVDSSAESTEGLAMIESNAFVGAPAEEEGKFINLSPLATTYVGVDSVEVQSTSFDAIDAETEEVRIGVNVSMYVVDATGGIGPGTQDSFLLENIGIGRIADGDGGSAYVPYGLMSGTSMATPVVAGACAQLASAYPDDSPLQLRGRLVGSTDEINVPQFDGSACEIATNGRINLATAMDASKVSANTWAAEGSVEDGTVTLHGYALDSASVAVDGAPANVVQRADDGSWLTVQVPASIFDGMRHRFDVTDESTGKSKTQYAAYELPLAESQGEPESPVSLERVCDLPQGAEAGSLVGTPAGLFYAGGEGSCLYRLADADASTWEACAAPGAPWDDGAGSDAPLLRERVAYAYLDGALYAFASDSIASDAEASGRVVYVAAYDIASDSWGGYQEIGRVEVESGSQAGDLAFSAVQCGGVVYCLAGVSSGGSTQTGAMMLARHASGQDGFDVSYLTSADTAGFALYSLSATQDQVVGFGVDGSEKLHAVVYDAAENAWSDGGVVSGTPTFDGNGMLDFADSVKVATGEGVLLTGGAYESSGDTALVASGASGWEWRSLGSYGTNGSAGFVVMPGDMMGGSLYLPGIDQRPDGDAVSGCVYRLPDSAGLVGFDRAVSARAGEGGSASVSDAFGSAQDATLTMRAGDTARWSATPQKGYAFAGWYDAAGTLVSSEAAYSAVVLGDVALEARFSLADDASGEVAPGGTSPEETLERLASTGDGLPLALGAIGAVAVTAGAVAAAARRRAR